MDSPNSVRSGTLNSGLLEIPPSPSNASATTDDNLYGSALLASLVRFIEPMISAIASPKPDFLDNAVDIGTEADQLCESVEGQALLKTLGSFVSLLINSRNSGNYKEQQDIACSNAEEQGIMEQHDEISDSNEVDQRRPLSIRSAGYLNPYMLPEKIVETVNYHIFNTMPIRMIAFDLNGTNCYLIERSLMASVILSRIQDAYPGGQGLTPSQINYPQSLVKDFSKYAILSHTWIRETPGDVLFHQWSARMLPKNSRGYSKIEKFCKIAAREHGVLFGWMDTACINKNSSTELDESIRSMYKWYKAAHVCIAYLADTEDFAQMSGDSWFTRGWTLQELLANQQIIFYNRVWKRQVLVAADVDEPLDDPRFRADPSLARNLTVMPLQVQYQVFLATTITQKELVQFYTDYAGYVPICRIMELAARRNVTRGEDKVYSLMGLLGVGIPIAYGEGSGNALRRMIQQIMISRHQFLDLFNHRNYFSLFPEDISDYINHPRSIRNVISPQDPLVLSHLGVHATLLAVPLFRKDIYENSIPPESVKEHISWGTVGFSVDTGGLYLDYLALDNSIYSTDWITGLHITLNARATSFSNLEAPPFIFLAILSSYVDQEHDLFQLSVGDSLGIPVLPDVFNNSDTDIVKKFTDIKPLTSSMGGAMNFYWNDYGPTKINLPYTGPNVSEDGSVLFLTAEIAKQFGFQVVTSYFR